MNAHAIASALPNFERCVDRTQRPNRHFSFEAQPESGSRLDALFNELDAVLHDVFAQVSLMTAMVMSSAHPMPSMKKTLKKYERPILLAVVVILLATFSVTGAVQCGQQGGGGSLEMGGSFNVAPSEREELSDREFDSLITRSQSFGLAMRLPPAPPSTRAR